MVTDAATQWSGGKFGAFFYNQVDDKGEIYSLYTLSGVPRSAFADFEMPRNTAVFAPTFDGTGIVRSDDIRKDPRYGRSGPHFGMPKGHLPVVSYLARSEEHTSELQSLMRISYAVFCLKKKTYTQQHSRK